MTKHGVSYIALNGSMVLFRNGRFFMVKFLLDHGEFTLGPHTAKNIAVWWQGVYSKFGLNSLVDIGTPTIDGASNGKAAARSVFKKPPATLGAVGRPNAPRICAGLQIQRDIAYATRKTGALNARSSAANMIIQFFRRTSSTFRRSTAFATEMYKAQRDVLGVGSEKKMSVPNATR